MHALRQYLWLPFLLTLTGCYGVDITPLVFNTSPFSAQTQAKGNAHCTDLYSNAQFKHLRGKMPVQPGGIPTRDMMSIATVPSDPEIRAIQALETAVRNCRKLRDAAGVPTSATEDIQASRISKLRYGLYKGEIPYAVYNYGVVQVIRKSNNFMMAAEKSAQEGKVVGQGRERQARLSAKMNTIIGNQHVLNNNQHALNNYYNSIPSGSWVCKGFCY